MDSGNVWSKILKSVVLLGFIYAFFYLVQNFDIYNVDQIIDTLHEMAEKSSVKIPFIVIAHGAPGIFRADFTRGGCGWTSL